MINCLSACNLFAVLLLYKLSLSLFQLSSAITPRPFITKAEILAVHSFVTIDYRDAIKWNLRVV